ncbi:hypothetical protein QWZ13_14190 [Reinekea marina]|nr:hypothetical protein [Reinekea marina]MDN3650066.1 hypothetical protein [Reinekea marina]
MNLSATRFVTSSCKASPPYAHLSGRALDSHSLALKQRRYRWKTI